MEFDSVEIPNERICIGCGNTFVSDNPRHKRCTIHCGRIGKNTQRELDRINHDIEFVAVDGEGINTTKLITQYNDDGEEETVREPSHEYVLLSVGDQSLHHNGEPLNYRQIFTFLWEQYLEKPHAAFIGFYLGYDFTMWLKTISYKAAYSLLTKDGIANRLPRADSGMTFPFPVRDGGVYYTEDGKHYKTPEWEFDILGMKRFKLRPYVKPEDIPTKTVQHKDGTWSTEKESRPWMYICDVGSFFQCSFLKAIDPSEWDGDTIVTEEEYNILKEGKESRSDAQFDETMIRYNLLENDVLARLMRVLNKGFVSDSIRLNKNQWFGPGQAAQTWMTNIGVPTGEKVREHVPIWAREAARKSYYGGWFEIFNHGPVQGKSFCYDINSAYPYVIASLPCLLHGTWREGTGTSFIRRNTHKSRNNLYLVYGTFVGKDEWVGPLPFREKDGSILRPHKVKGWYWWNEIQASKRAGLIHRMVIEQWVSYEPCACVPPMESICALYEGRLQVGKNTPQGKAKKLVYNSTYGKCAQSIGSPKFSNSIYASLITAGCRTQILDAIATHPTKSNSLLMVATDGIVFKEQHPNLNIHPTELGAWDDEVYYNLPLFMPGLYWHDKAREHIKAGKTPSLKSRGVNARYLGTIIDQVDRKWKKYDGVEFKAPRVSLTIPWALIGAKQAIVRNKWWTCGESVFNAERWVDGSPYAKRAHMWRGSDSWGGLRSTPYEVGTQLETTYYAPTFGDEMRSDDESNLVTQDGVIGDLQAWSFGIR